MRMGGAEILGIIALAMIAIVVVWLMFLIQWYMDTAEWWDDGNVQTDDQVNENEQRQADTDDENGGNS